MTLANLQKHHKRLKWLASGEFTERDFDFKVDANDNPNGEKGEAGRTTQGDFINKGGAKRKELIIYKAKNALEKFEKKYKEFKEPVKETKTEPIPKTTPKSKEKK